MSNLSIREKIDNEKLAVQLSNQGTDDPIFGRSSSLSASAVLEDETNIAQPWIFDANLIAIEAKPALLLPYKVNEEFENTRSATKTWDVYEKTRGEVPRSLIGPNLRTLSDAWLVTTPTEGISPASSDEVVSIYSGFKLTATAVSSTKFEQSTAIPFVSGFDFKVMEKELTDALPLELSLIQNAIHQSEWILNLTDNWDDAGGSRYDPETLKAAVSFLVKYSVEIFNKEDFLIPPPRITPGPDASIDFFWGENKYGLLINFEPEPSDSITFYGEEKNGNYIKGKLKRGELKRAIMLFLMA